MPEFRQTRIAPTPSGYLHLGNVVSFSVTAALARRVGASILLRIDDLDRDRVSREYVEDIFETLKFLGISWDEGPRDFVQYEREWSQLRRLEMYREALQRLREGGWVFACDCSRSKIMREREDGAYPGTCRERGLSLDMEGCSWRVRTRGGEVVRSGEVMGGEVGGGGPGGEVVRGGALPVEMTDFMVRKKDGYPAYQLTSVVDDVYFGIDMVVRGEDLRASTAAQRWLAGVLGFGEFEQIGFYHHPLLLGVRGEKLSKSAGDTSVRHYRQQGVGAREVFGIIAGMYGFKAGSWAELGEGLIEKWGRFGTL